MYCSNCGAKLKDNAFYCGKCGSKRKQIVQYVEEKKMDSILSNGVVVAYTLGVIALSIVSIIVASYLTKDVPVFNKFNSTYTSVVVR